MTTGLQMGTLKPVYIILCLGLILGGGIGCGNSPSGEPKDVALSINGSEISIQEFNEQIKCQAYTDPEMDISLADRERFADYLIQKELMLQEAVKLDLDQKESFTRAIEKYWESTLIRVLLDTKTESIKKDILVTQEEMEAYYVKNKAEFGRPYDEVKAGIQSILESKHLEEKFEAWTRQLRQSAKITVNKAVVNRQ